MWAARATVACPLASEDGGRSPADGANPIANIAEKLANIDVIVEVLLNMVNPFREPYDRYHDGNRSLKSGLCLCVGDRTYHDPRRNARLHRWWHHIRGVVGRNDGGGYPLGDSGVVAGSCDCTLPARDWKIHVKRRSRAHWTHYPQSAPEGLDPVDQADES